MVVRSTDLVFTAPDRELVDGHSLLIALLGRNMGAIDFLADASLTRLIEIQVLMGEHCKVLLLSRPVLLVDASRDDGLFDYVDQGILIIRLV